jgi:hypothetical protein
MNSKRVLTWVNVKNVISASGVIIAAGRLLLVASQYTLPDQALACAHVPGARSMVPSDGVAVHVSTGAPSFNPGLLFLDDGGDLDDVLCCGCCVGRTLHMASKYIFDNIHVVIIFSQLCRCLNAPDLLIARSHCPS